MQDKQIHIQKEPASFFNYSELDLAPIGSISL